MVVKKCTSYTSLTSDAAALLSKVSEVKKRWEIEGHQLERKQYYIKPVQAWSLRQKGDFRGVPVKAKAMAEAGRVEEAPAPPTSNWPNEQVALSNRNPSFLRLLPQNEEMIWNRISPTYWQLSVCPSDCFHFCRQVAWFTHDAGVSGSAAAHGYALLCTTHRNLFPFHCYVGSLDRRQGCNGNHSGLLLEQLLPWMSPPKETVI